MATPLGLVLWRLGSGSHPQKNATVHMIVECIALKSQQSLERVVKYQNTYALCQEFIFSSILLEITLVVMH